MPMSIFCEALGLPDIGEKKKNNSQTVALNTHSRLILQPWSEEFQPSEDLPYFVPSP